MAGWAAGQVNERQLFDLIDSDGDDHITAQVRGRARFQARGPAAPGPF